MSAATTALQPPALVVAPCTENPDLFDPDIGDVEAAKRVCGGCSRREACLGEALANGEEGVWGATTEAERRRMGSAPVQRGRRDRLRPVGPGQGGSSAPAPATGTRR
ncbi:WhiB family transcriptional regulator [uncultured Pseudokineococcus sp.]|uniref:WhiB family transcriptional regulator n=1 Tax=uncultured Pseudokineococcus sp. TaxID=1642928 RepID=UPI00261FAE85|nr:WhiB family transcriptional regulator [uncultured Pseudokineococcus sp.]